MKLVQLCLVPARDHRLDLGGSLTPRFLIVVGELAWWLLVFCNFDGAAARDHKLRVLYLAKAITHSTIDGGLLEPVNLKN